MHETLQAALRSACAIAAIAVLPACDRGPAADEIAEAAQPAPAEAPAEMSYEVAIAIAAANRNRALEGCEAWPPADRHRCRLEVLADWEVARAGLEDLRGDSN